MECNIILAAVFCALCALCGYLLGRLEGLQAALPAQENHGELPAQPQTIDPRLQRQMENLLRYDGTRNGQREVDD